MINRILVPRNATLGAEDKAAPGTRRKTAMDTRTVIAADLPAGHIDAVSNIPAYMPLDVLSSRMVIPRDMPIHALDVERTTPAYVSLDVLGKHIAIPKDAVLPQTAPVRHAMQHAAEMPEVLDPDLLTTGEVHLMTDGPRSLRDEQKWVLRGTSAVLHAAAIAIILLIPSLFTSRQPTQAEIIAASHSLGDLYMPPDLRSALHPGPRINSGSNPIHIDPKIIRKLTPPEPVTQPKVEAPVAPVVHDQPKETAAPPPLPVAPQPQPAKPQPSLEPIRADQPPTPHGLILPNTSIGHTLSHASNDATQPGVGGGVSSIVAPGRMPGGRRGSGGGGMGGGGGQAGAGLTMLTDPQGVDFSAYNSRIIASVKRNWYSIMPESALMGDTGIVYLRFRIFKDGTVVAEEPILERSSNKTPLDRAAMGSIRASSPFEPLPPAFSGPFVEYQFVYFYNLEIPGGR
jgi:outer membrane biosynthesis protein TonB